MRTRRGVIMVAAFVLLALFVFRPGANGLRKRIVNSVSLALGRKVDVDWVKLRILPQLGFDLENFVVHDDPAVSAEPVLRAQEVTAVLRLRSLLRGRLEIGRLSLKEPSFNLVRSQDGHWNIESLLEKAAHANAAPTRNTLPERRPMFPYIEADNGRINFKVGAEKKAYALTNADFALWLESDDQWGMRLLAQPLRTDYNLTDTGLLRLDGTWQRSLALRDTPVEFHLAWNHAQLGQLTKLLYGNDKGWRGGLNISAAFTGTPADLLVKVKASVEDFRRYDIVSQDSLRLSSTCEANYSSVERALTNIICRSPVGNGTLLLEGRIEAPTGPRSYDLKLTAQDLPLQALVSVGHHVKKDLPDDLTAAGTLDGTFAVQTSHAGNRALQWTGNGQTEEFVLRSSLLKTDLSFGAVPFSLDSLDFEPRIKVGPSRLQLGRSSYATLQAWATKTGYQIGLQGDAQVQRLLDAGQSVGLPLPHPLAEGIAKINLQVAGAWSDSAAAQITGNAQLHSVRAALHGVSAPLNISSANILLEPGAIKVRNLIASAAGSNWTGSLWYSRPCRALSSCALHVDLHADTVATGKLQQWLHPGASKRPWYRLGSGARPAPPLLTVLNAEGQVAATRVEIRDLVATHVSSKITLRDGQMQLSGITGDFLGGKHRGDWEADLRVSPPNIKAAGEFERVALDQLANAMHAGWVSGTATATYAVSGSGATLQDFVSSATADLRFEMRDGLLSRVVMPSSSTPLRVRRFRGRLTLRSGTYELQDARLDDGNEAYQVTGTASSAQKLDMRLVRNGNTFVVNGTLSQPHVIPAAIDTQAALKP